MRYSKLFSRAASISTLVSGASFSFKTGVAIRNGASLVGDIFREAIDAGTGDNYFPVISKLIDAPDTSSKE